MAQAAVSVPDAAPAAAAAAAARVRKTLTSAAYVLWTTRTSAYWVRELDGGVADVDLQAVDEERLWRVRHDASRGGREYFVNVATGCRVWSLPVDGAPGAVNQKYIEKRATWKQQNRLRTGKSPSVVPPTPQPDADAPRALVGATKAAVSVVPLGESTMATVSVDVEVDTADEVTSASGRNQSQSSASACMHGSEVGAPCELVGVRARAVPFGNGVELPGALWASSSAAAAGHAAAPTSEGPEARVAASRPHEDVQGDADTTTAPGTAAAWLGAFTRAASPSLGTGSDGATAAAMAPPARAATGSYASASTIMCADARTATASGATGVVSQADVVSSMGDGSCVLGPISTVERELAAWGVDAGGSMAAPVGGLSAICVRPVGVNAAVLRMCTPEMGVDAPPPPPTPAETAAEGGGTRTRAGGGAATPAGASVSAAGPVEARSSSRSSGAVSASAASRESYSVMSFLHPLPHALEAATTCGGGSMPPSRCPTRLGSASASATHTATPPLRPATTTTTPIAPITGHRSASAADGREPPSAVDHSHNHNHKGNTTTPATQSTPALSTSTVRSTPAQPPSKHLSPMIDANGLVGGVAHTSVRAQSVAHTHTPTHTHTTSRSVVVPVGAAAETVVPERRIRGHTGAACGDTPAAEGVTDARGGAGAGAGVNVPSCGMSLQHNGGVRPPSTGSGTEAVAGGRGCVDSTQMLPDDSAADTVAVGTAPATAHAPPGVAPESVNARWDDVRRRIMNVAAAHGLNTPRRTVDGGAADAPGGDSAVSPRLPVDHPWARFFDPVVPPHDVAHPSPHSQAPQPDASTSPSLLATAVTQHDAASHAATDPASSFATARSDTAALGAAHRADDSASVSTFATQQHPPAHEHARPVLGTHRGRSASSTYGGASEVSNQCIGEARAVVAATQASTAEAPPKRGPPHGDDDCRRLAQSGASGDPQETTADVAARGGGGGPPPEHDDIVVAANEFIDANFDFTSCGGGGAGGPRVPNNSMHSSHPLVVEPSRSRRVAEVAAPSPHAAPASTITNMQHRHHVHYPSLAPSGATHQQLAPASTHVCARDRAQASVCAPHAGGVVDGTRPARRTAAASCSPCSAASETSYTISDITDFEGHASPVKGERERERERDDRDGVILTSQRRHKAGPMSTAGTSNSKQPSSIPPPMPTPWQTRARQTSSQATQGPPRSMTWADDDREYVVTFAEEGLGVVHPALPADVDTRSAAGGGVGARGAAKLATATLGGVSVDNHTCPTPIHTPCLPSADASTTQSGGGRWREASLSAGGCTTAAVSEAESVGLMRDILHRLDVLVGGSVPPEGLGSCGSAHAAGIPPPPHGSPRSTHAGRTPCESAASDVEPPVHTRCTLRLRPRGGAPPATMGSLPAGYVQRRGPMRPPENPRPFEAHNATATQHQQLPQHEPHMPVYTISTRATKATAIGGGRGSVALFGQAAPAAIPYDHGLMAPGWGRVAGVADARGGAPTAAGRQQLQRCTRQARDIAHAGQPVALAAAATATGFPGGAPQGHRPNPLQPLVLDPLRAHGDHEEPLRPPTIVPAARAGVAETPMHTMTLAAAARSWEVSTTLCSPSDDERPHRRKVAVHPMPCPPRGEGGDEAAHEPTRAPALPSSVCDAGEAHGRECDDHHPHGDDDSPPGTPIAPEERGVSPLAAFDHGVGVEGGDVRDAQVAAAAVAALDATRDSILYEGDDEDASEVRTEAAHVQPAQGVPAPATASPAPSRGRSTSARRAHPAHGYLSPEHVQAMLRRARSQQRTVAVDRTPTPGRDRGRDRSRDLTTPRRPSAAATPPSVDRRGQQPRARSAQAGGRPRSTGFMAIDAEAYCPPHPQHQHDGGFGHAQTAPRGRAGTSATMPQPQPQPPRRAHSSGGAGSGRVASRRVANFLASPQNLNERRRQQQQQQQQQQQGHRGAAANAHRNTSSGSTGARGTNRNGTGARTAVGGGSKGGRRASKGAPVRPFR